MKKGICGKNEENIWVVRYKCPEGAGLAYCEMPIDEKSIHLAIEGEMVEFEIETSLPVVSNGLFHKSKQSAMIIKKTSLHSGVSKLGTGHGVNKHLTSTQSVPEAKEYIGQLFFTKEEGWIIKYNYQIYKHKSSIINSQTIKVHPKQASVLTENVDNEKYITFNIADFYIEPSIDIHSNRGDFIKVGKIKFSKSVEEFSLFTPEAHSIELFAIKENLAFIGYKIPNGNFHYEQILYTEPKNSSLQIQQKIKNYTKEQIELQNIEEYESTWLSTVCEFWYNQGKNENKKPE